MQLSKKQIIIAGVGFVVLVVVMIVVAIAQTTPKPYNDSGAKTYVDDITGETIHEDPNRTPETFDQSGPIILGLTNLSDLFADDNVIDILKKEVLTSLYTKHQKVKIAKADIARAVHTSPDGITTIDVKFLIYLDDDKTRKDSTTVNFNQETGSIVVAIDGDYNKSYHLTTTVFGQDD